METVKDRLRFRFRLRKGKKKAKMKIENKKLSGGQHVIARGLYLNLNLNLINRGLTLCEGKYADIDTFHETKLPFVR